MHIHGAGIFALGKCYGSTARNIEMSPDVARQVGGAAVELFKC